MAIENTVDDAAISASIMLITAMNLSKDPINTIGTPKAAKENTSATNENISAKQRINNAHNGIDRFFFCSILRIFLFINKFCDSFSEFAGFY